MVVDLHVCMSDNAFMPLDDVSASEAFIGRECYSPYVDSKIINWGLGLLFSISAAASAIILSSGRMEDAIALQAIGIPFMENFQIAAADYVLKHRLLPLSFLF